MKTWIKWTLILVPIGIGGYIVYKQIKKYTPPKKKALPNTNGVLPKGDKNKVVDTTGCIFPLQMGSKNACVGQLQDALGVSIDNSFGNQTLNALQEQAGISSITDSKHLQEVIDQIAYADSQDVSGKVAAANAILSQYVISLASPLSQPYKYISTSSTPDTWQQVTRAGENSPYLSAGYQITDSSNTNYPISDYIPYDVDSDTGNLIIFCNNGDNWGYWSADPNNISLV
jgi:hypothetical protein